MKQLLAALLAATTLPTLIPAAEVANSGETNAPPAIHLLPTNQPSFFWADNSTSATYMKFAPDGCYEVIQKEHMGVMPRDEGRWTQATNGVITLTSANQKRAGEPQQQVTPMTYRGRTFLVWPEVSYKSNLQRARAALDAGKTPRYHEFTITEQEYKKGTAKPYPFKYRKEMNKVTGAQE